MVEWIVIFHLPGDMITNDVQQNIDLAVKFWSPN